eukprot:8126369-Lingulodinium_polyedra.AAC.1
MATQLNLYLYITQTSTQLPACDDDVGCPTDELLQPPQEEWAHRTLDCLTRIGRTCFNLD